MRISLVRGLGSAALAVAVLAGCGGSQPPIGAPGVPAAHPSRVQSWMSPAAKKSEYLLYVVDSSTGTVNVFDFKSQKLLGSTSNPAQWLCSDKKGDIYGGDHSYYGGSEITEFAAGTLTVIKKLSDGAGYPLGCSVNPKNGDLAVTNYYDEDHDGGGNVLIYKHASGSPTKYYGPAYEWPAGYDPSGNLFVAGEAGICSDICLAELPYGGSSFEALSFNHQIYSPIAVEWDGKYLGVGDQEVDGDSTSGIYETRVSGSTATVVRTVKLTGPDGSDADLTGWENVSSKPNDLPAKLDTQILGETAFPYTELYEWAYPAGGNPSGQFTSQAYPEASLLIRVK